MMLRSTLGPLALLLAGAGGFAGYYYFNDAADWMGWTTFGLTLRLSVSALTHARYSFAVASALSLASIPLAGMLAMQFARKAPYWRVMSKALLAGALVFIATAWYHRQQARTFGGRLGEGRALFSDSRRFVLWNPMSQVVIFAGAGALAYGFLKGTLLYSKDGR